MKRKVYLIVGAYTENLIQKVKQLAKFSVQRIAGSGSNIKAILCIIASAIILLSAIPAVAATITIDPLNAVYSVGEDITLSFTITRATNAHGFLTADLSCDEGSTEIYKTPLRSSVGEQKKIAIPTKFDRFLIGNLSQGCTIFITYGDEVARSTRFEISSTVFVLARVQENVVQPGSSVFLSGSAIKKNGKAVDGIVDIVIPDLNLSSSTLVSNGLFNISLPVSARARAQSYVIEIHAYERDGDGIQSNAGRTIASFKVPSVLTTSELALERTSADPRDRFGFTLLTQDQAGEPMNLESNVAVSTQGERFVLGERLQTGQLHYWIVPWNATPGTWVIEASAGELRRSKQIKVNAVRNVTFTLDNDTLVITNYGNVPVNEQMSVSIQGKPTDVPVSLGVGGHARFKLFAPEGTHPVSVLAGNDSAELGNVFLTGRAIDVRNADSRDWSVDPWIWWLILILVAASIAIRVYRKYARRATWGHTPRSSSSETYKPQTQPKTRTMVAPVLENRQGGKKEECTIVALHIKNLAHLEVADGPTSETIARAIARAKSARANVYNQGSHKVIIFSPEAVGNPAQAAISLARDLERIFTEHNKQYALKIAFGIGVNKGPMIVEPRGGAPHFTSVGTTVVGAKRLADHSKGDILIGDDIYRSFVGKIKVEKIAEKTWRLKEGANIGRNAEFLKRFYKERS